MEKLFLTNFSITVFILAISSTVALLSVPKFYSNNQKKAILFFAIAFSLPPILSILSHVINFNHNSYFLENFAIPFFHFIGVYIFKYGYCYRSKHPLPKISYIFIHTLFLLGGLIFISKSSLFVNKALAGYVFSVINLIIITTSILKVVKHVDHKTHSRGEKVIYVTLIFTIIMLITYPFLYNSATTKLEYTLLIMPLNFSQIHIWVMGLLILLLDDVVNEYKYLACTDRMTDLYNREHFFNTAEDFIKTSKQGSLILCDLDLFKNINDTYGHDVGDKVIIAFAHILKKITIEDKVVARLGGEEFAIFLPNCSPEEAVKIAENIRKVTEDTVINYNETDITFTSSFGVSTASNQISKALKQADLALYKAKELGRNTVIYTI